MLRGGMRTVGWALACLGLLGMGCGDRSGSSARSGTASAAGNRDRPRLLFISNASSDWWGAVEKGLQDGADEVGAVVELRRNDGTAEGQIRLLEDALALRDVLGVAVSVVEADAAGVAEAMQRLQDAGKVVITVDSDVAPRFADVRRAYVGSVNRKAGELAGKTAATLRPEGGRVAIFVGLSAAANAIERKEGFFAGAGPKFVEAEAFDDNSQDSRAQENVQTAITKDPNLKVLLGLWSPNAPAIGEVLSHAPAARKKLTVVTFDLEERAIEHLARRRIDATVCQNPYEIGRQGVHLLKALINSDEKALADLLPRGAKMIDTGLRVVVPDADSPVKGDNVLTIDAMKSWLASKGLRST